MADEGQTFEEWINACLEAEAPSGTRADRKKWMEDNLEMIIEKNKELEG